MMSSLSQASRHSLDLAVDGQFVRQPALVLWDLPELVEEMLLYSGVCIPAGLQDHVCSAAGSHKEGSPGRFR